MIQLNKKIKSNDFPLLKQKVYKNGNGITKILPPPLPRKKNKFDSSIINDNINDGKIVNAPYIEFQTIVEIPPGNFFYPLTQNYRIFKSKTEENNFFFRYFGEDRIDEVNVACKEILKNEKNEKKEKRQSNGSDRSSQDTKNSEGIIPDDLVTNCIITEIIKESMRKEKKKRQSDLNNSTGGKGELLDIFYDKFKHKFPLQFNIQKNTFKIRVRTLFNRITANNNHTNQAKFYYMSCVITEEKKFNNIVGTNKQIYCCICFIYDCKVHGIKIDKDFDNPDCYTLKDSIKTFREIHDLSYQAMTKTIKSDNMFYERKINNNIKEYNALIKHFKLDSLGMGTNEIKLNDSEKLTLDIEIETCSKYCYKNFLQIGDDKKNQIWNEHNYQFSETYELYFGKLFEIFKYNPCMIFKCLKMLENNRHVLLECTNVYIRLISNAFSIDKIITKINVDYNNMIRREKVGKNRNNMNMERIRKIKKNMLESKYMNILILKFRCDSSLLSMSSSWKCRMR
jgi:hypothetical protein